MDATDAHAPPPEARLIRRVREAAGLTAADAAKATGGMVSAVYWRDVERGSGYRRGDRAKTTASARLLARMAFAVGVTPERLEEEGQRADAAEILREILRGAAQEGGEENRAALLADVRSRYPGDQVAEAIMSQWHKPLEVRQRELGRWRGPAGEARA